MTFEGGGDHIGRAAARWSLDEKERLVAASLELGAIASEAARMAGLHVSQLCRSRKELCKHTEASR
ncbi:transposase [Bradyrhizobium sp. ISRA442]|uniref:hypothetical protein n=1 Tax=Bradyrhizobium sp. ISRA442 TaxID=2866197 RepID=UPI00311B1CAB